MSFDTSLCVYCGSGLGVDSRHVEAARDLGRLLAARRIRLIYGGARIGLMGTLADSALTAGGEVVGIIPGHLDKTEFGHRGATELIVVDSMHRRKYMMFELSDAFAILPGGLGTLDEAFEILTWRKLGLHDKPVVRRHRRLLAALAGVDRPCDRPRLRRPVRPRSLQHRRHGRGAGGGGREGAAPEARGPAGAPLV